MRDPRIVELALGRIFRIMSRPFRPGDIEEYERCRALVLDHADPATVEAAYQRQACWASDRNKGAQGD